MSSGKHFASEDTSSPDKGENIFVPSDTTEALKNIAQNRDREAFIRIFSYYAPRLKSFLLRGGFPDQTAEELVQETFLTIWKKAKSYNPEKASPSTWIYTIARNKKIDYLRKYSRPEPDPEDLKNSEQIHPIDALQRKQESDEIRNLLKELPKEQAQLIRKAFYEDKSHQEIADETGIPLGTVKSRIRLGLKKLKSGLNEDLIELS